MIDPLSAWAERDGQQELGAVSGIKMPTRRPEMSERDKAGRSRHSEEGEPQEQKGPLGDVLPGRSSVDPRVRPGKSPEKVEDRPNVGTTTPEAYPENERNSGRTR